MTAEMSPGQQAVLAIMREHPSGIAPTRIRIALERDHDVHVTRETVQRWMHDLRDRGLAQQAGFGVWRPARQSGTSAGTLRTMILEIIRERGAQHGITPRDVMLRLDQDHGLLLTRESAQQWLHDLRDAGLIRLSQHNLWQPVPQPVLRWDKPERAEPHEDWAQYQPDGGPPGAWMPNMSEAGKRSWKAVLKGQRSDELYVEIRKSVQADMHNLAQVLIVVWESGLVVTSQNGRAAWSPEEWEQLPLAVAEARAAMEAFRNRQAYRP